LLLLEARETWPLNVDRSIGHIQRVAEKRFIVDESEKRFIVDERIVIR
jgi:hypothetical protein